MNIQKIDDVKEIQKIFSTSKTREELLQMEEAIKSLPTAYDECPYPLFHNLENGMYVREIHMKAGDLVVSRIHKDDYFITMLSGRNYLVNQYESLELCGPVAFKIKGGAKNILYILEDTVWIDTHKVKSETIEEAEKEIFLDSFDDYDEYTKTLQGEKLVDQPAVDKVEIKEEKVFITEDVKEGDLFALARILDFKTPVGKYIKHSDEPNSKGVTDGNLGMLVAKRDIKAGEEITVNHTEITKQFEYMDEVQSCLVG